MSEFSSDDWLLNAYSFSQRLMSHVCEVNPLNLSGSMFSVSRPRFLTVGVKLTRDFNIYLSNWMPYSLIASSSHTTHA